MFFQEEELSGWGNIPKSRSNVAYPHSTDDMIAAIGGSKIISRGLGRSYADQATNKENAVFNLRKLNKFVSFDKHAGILCCEAGISFEEIIDVCTPLGWFPMVTPGTKFITVGGAIANDVHGKAHHVDGSFINCVDSFTILLANGENLTCSRAENADLFWANFGGLGLLGIILTATFRLRKIETTYFVQKAFAAKNLDEMLDAIDANENTYSSSVAWIDSLAKGKRLGRGVLVMGNWAKVSDLPARYADRPLRIGKKSKLTVPFYLPSFTLNTFTVRLLNMALYFLQKNTPAVAHYDKFFYPLDMINDWNRGYGKRGFIQYQFVIPMEGGRENIRKILTEITQSGCVPFLNVLKKFGKGEKYLSFPFEGYTFAIDFPVTPKLKDFTRKLDNMVLEMGGRIYLGKDAYLDETMFKAMYPEYKQWLEIKRKYDPENVFSSDISRRLGLDIIHW